MSTTEQLLYPHINHFGLGYCAHSPFGSHMGSSEPKDASNSGDYAQIDGQHQELFGLQRNSTQGEPSVHPFLW